MEDDVLYYEDYLKKRDDKNCWKEYWVSLLNTALVFFENKDCYTNEFIEKIRLSPNSRCLLAKRRTYSFRFRLITEEGSFLFKCDSNLQRHRWIRMIQLVIKQRPPQSPPNCISVPYDYDQNHSDEERTKYTNNELSKDEIDFKDENSEAVVVGYLHAVDENLNVDRKTCWTNSLENSEYRVFENDMKSPLALRKLAGVRITQEAIHRLTRSSNQSNHEKKSQPSSVSSESSEKTKEVIGLENFGFTADEIDSIFTNNKKRTDILESLDHRLSEPESEFPAVKRIVVQPNISAV